MGKPNNAYGYTRVTSEDERFKIDIDKPDDADGRTKVMTCDGRKFILTHSDPYGHYRITWDKGKIPTELASVYTCADEAAKAIQNYLKQAEHASAIISKKGDVLNGA